MTYLVDAQLPRGIALGMQALGLDACHTLDLADGNRTPDARLIEIADTQGRVLVSKDADFVDSHLLRGRPARLLLISTGNIANRDLYALLAALIPAIDGAFDEATFIELPRTGFVVRG